MRVMVLVKATSDSEKGFLPTPEAKQAMEAMGRFADLMTSRAMPASRAPPAASNPPHTANVSRSMGPAVGLLMALSPRPGIWPPKLGLTNS